LKEKNNSYILILPAAPAIGLWENRQIWREKAGFGGRIPDLAEKFNAKANL